MKIIGKIVWSFFAICGIISGIEACIEMYKYEHSDAMKWWRTYVKVNEVD